MDSRRITRRRPMVEDDSLPVRLTDLELRMRALSAGWRRRTPCPLRRAGSRPGKSPGLSWPARRFGSPSMARHLGLEAVRGLQHAATGRDKHEPHIIHRAKHAAIFHGMSRRARAETRRERQPEAASGRGVPLPPGLSPSGNCVPLPRVGIREAEAPARTFGCRHRCLADSAHPTGWRHAAADCDESGTSRAIAHPA